MTGAGRRTAQLATAGLVGVALARATGADFGRWLIAVQAVARWALLPAHLLALVAARRRWPEVTAVAAGLAAYQLALTRSGRGRGRPDPARPDSTPIRLASANLLWTNPTVEAAARLLVTESVDVLALQELTPEHLTALRDTGLLDHLPYAVVSAEPGYHGGGLFSRWPLVDPALIDLDGVTLPTATAVTPDGPLRIAVVHAKNPGAVGELRRWQRQLRQLAALAAGSPVPVVLVGDYNATADHRAFRRLLATGLRDAYDVVGTGSGVSWPVWPGRVPPLLRLDHALVSGGIAVRSAVVGDTAGSDHRHLRVELRLVAAGTGEAGPS